MRGDGKWWSSGLLLSHSLYRFGRKGLRIATFALCTSWHVLEMYIFLTVIVVLRA